MVSGTKAEPGTIAYEWYISPDAALSMYSRFTLTRRPWWPHHISEGFMMKNLGRTIHGVVSTRRGASSTATDAAAREILDRLSASYRSAWAGSRASSSC